MFNNSRVVPVSVVVPCYCCSQTLLRAIESVFAQTVIPTEIITIDDCSTDGTSLLLNELSIKYKGILKVITLEANVGAASARNVGWSLATQPYIAFLDADDAWHPKKLEIQVEYMTKNPQISLCGHHYKVLKDTQMLTEWSLKNFDSTLISKRAMLMSNKLVTPSIMLKRSLPNRFLEGRRFVDDHLLWLELIFEGHKIAKLNIELVAIYKELFGFSGLSSNLWLMEKNELLNYGIIFKKGYINIFQWMSIFIYSFLKYIRRLFIYEFYIRQNKNKVSK